MTNLAKTDEAFVVSLSSKYQLFDYVYDSSSHPAGFYFKNDGITLTDSSTDPLSAASASYKHSIAADMDGNGKQEIVIAAFSTEASQIVFYRIADSITASGNKLPIDQAASVTWATASAATSDITTNQITGNVWSTQRYYQYAIDMAAGDIDGDGYDEIVITHHGRLSIYDHDFKELTKVATTFTDLGTTYETLRVECADLNHDGKAEIVVAQGSFDAGKVAQASVFETAVTTAQGTPKVSRLEQFGPVSLTTIGSTPISIRTAEVKLGDIDGDHDNEIVFAGLKKDAGEIRTMVMDFTLTENTLGNFKILGTSQSSDLPSVAAAARQQNGEGNRYNWEVNRDRDAMIPILAVADLDMVADNRDEIIANDDVLQFDANKTTLDYAFGATSSKDALRQDLTLWSAHIPSLWTPDQRDTAYYNNVVTGDFNGDGKGEILLMDVDPNTDTTYLRRFSYDTATKTIVKDDADTKVSGITLSDCPHPVRRGRRPR